MEWVADALPATSASMLVQPVLEENSRGAILVLSYSECLDSDPHYVEGVEEAFIPSTLSADTSASLSRDHQEVITFEPLPAEMRFGQALCCV